MVETIVLGDGVQRGGSPRLLVEGPKDEAVQPGPHQGTGTHGTGFEGDVERAVRQKLCAERVPGGPERQHFGVGRRVVPFLDAIVSATDYPIVPNDDGADGNLAGRGGRLGGLEGAVHPPTMRVQKTVETHGRWGGKEGGLVGISDPMILYNRSNWFEDPSGEVLSLHHPANGRINGDTGKADEPRFGSAEPVGSVAQVH